MTRAPVTRQDNGSYGARDLNEVEVAVNGDVTTVINLGTSCENVLHVEQRAPGLKPAGDRDQQVLNRSIPQRQNIQSQPSRA